MSPTDGIAYRPTPDGFVVSASTRSVTGHLYCLTLAAWIAVVAANPAMWPRWNAFLPLLLGMTLLQATAAAIGVFGRVEVRRTGNIGSLFAGVGDAGITRRFDWRELRAILEGHTIFRNGFGARRKVIVFEFKPGTRKTLRFGATLPATRREALLELLRQLA
ncbi:MAG: hypothetical protein U0Q16_17350 [Bryobacteraceae bacterium]